MLNLINMRLSSGIAAFSLLYAILYPWHCLALNEESHMAGARQVSEHWIPFTMPDGRYIVVQANIGGHETEMVVDSAVGNLVLSRSFASQLSAETSGKVVAVGVTGQAVGGMIAGPKIRLGNITVHPQSANVFDLTPFNVATGLEINAVIGRDLFAHYIVDIDIENSKLAVASQTAWTNWRDWTHIPLTFEPPGSRAMPVSIEGKEPIQAIFDLGSDTPLYLSAEYADRIHLLDGKRQSTSMSMGVEGSKVNKVAVLDQVRVGNVPVHDVPVAIPQRWQNRAPVVVGLPILQRFRLVVNFEKNAMAIRPNQSAINVPFRKDRSGIGAGRDGDSLRIVHVAEHSPAALAGLKVGDVITSINGRKLDSGYFKSRPSEGSKPAGTVLHLGLSTGKEMDLRLSDYY
jgi:predicted aspartyl protease